MTVFPLSWQEKITSPFQTDCCYQAVVPFTSEPWLANIGAPSWAFKKTGSQCTGLASPNNWLQRSRWQPPTAGLLSVQQQEMSRRAHQLGVNITWNPQTSPSCPTSNVNAFQVTAAAALQLVCCTISGLCSGMRRGVGDDQQHTHEHSWYRGGTQIGWITQLPLYLKI